MVFVISFNLQVETPFFTRVCIEVYKSIQILVSLSDRPCFYCTRVTDGYQEWVTGRTLVSGRRWVLSENLRTSLSSSGGIRKKNQSGLGRVAILQDWVYMCI